MIFFRGEIPLFGKECKEIYKVWLESNQTDFHTSMIFILYVVGNDGALTLNAPTIYATILVTMQLLVCSALI